MFTQFVFNVIIDTVEFTSVTIFNSSPSFLPSLGLIEYFFFFNIVLKSSMCIQIYYHEFVQDALI